MLQLNYIKENRNEVIERLFIKNVQNAEEKINQIIALDNNRRQLQKESDDVKALANQLARQIGGLIKEGKTTEAEQAKQQTAECKVKEKQFNDELTSVEEELNNMLLAIPNLPHKSVPMGRTAEDNEVVKEWGEIPQLPDNAMPHWDLCEKYDIIDFALGNKITGAGFPLYKGNGARLQRALISFFLDRAVAAGFLEVQPPLMVSEQSAMATGQLPDKEGQMYHVTLDNLYLIPTAEVPVTNIFRDVILQEKDFPIKRCAYSQCFRREAGSYGKDVRGLNRLHQFDKVEIVVIEHPNHSYEQLKQMKHHVEGLLQALELPYRILRLCGGDMSFTSALTFDFEVFSAAQKRWLEVSSVSNFETFQSNRMKLRFKSSEGRTQLAHTLNGSALALPRIVAALLENHQTSDGIYIPLALQTYCGFEILK
jgi:seryl-tRNA synthetase